MYLNFRFRRATAKFLVYDCREGKLIGWFVMYVA